MLTPQHLLCSLQQLAGTVVPTQTLCSCAQKDFGRILLSPGDFKLHRARLQKVITLLAQPQSV